MGKGVTYLLVAGVVVLVGFFLLLLSWGMALVIGPVAGLVTVPVVLVMGYGVAPPGLADAGAPEGRGDWAENVVVHFIGSLALSPYWFWPTFALWSSIEPLFASDVVAIAAGMLACAVIFLMGFTAWVLAVVRWKYGPLRRRYVASAVVVSVAYAMAYGGLMYAGLVYL